MKDVEEFEKEMAAKKEREHAKVMQFKALQEEQVADRECRIRRVCLLCHLTMMGQSHSLRLSPGLH